MKYEIGTIVILMSEKTVYITEYNEKTRKYTGFDVDDENSKDDIEFFEDEVMLKV